MPLLQCHVKQGIRTRNVNEMFLFASLWGRGALLLCKKIFSASLGLGKKNASQWRRCIEFYNLVYAVT